MGRYWTLVKQYNEDRSLKRKWNLLLTDKRTEVPWNLNENHFHDFTGQRVRCDYDGKKQKEMELLCHE